jgi:hypothetical protein
VTCIEQLDHLLRTQAGDAGRRRDEHCSAPAPVQSDFN